MAEIECAASEYVKTTGIKALKPEQLEILTCVLNQKDCFAMLPTGFGKSLPHQIYLPVKKALRLSDVHVREHVLVCSPLVSLMEDQVQRMSSLKNVTAAYKGKDPETDQLIENGHYDVVFASPESLVDDDWVRKLKSVALLVVDECHTVSTWGGLDSSEDKAFRKSFRYVGTLRSLFPEATLLALSGTCTIKMKQQILNVLSMTNASIVELSPNRENIKYMVIRTPVEVEETFFWMVEKLSVLQKQFPRTLIYCNSIQDVCKIYFYLTTEINCENTDLVEMFHSETPEDKKVLIISKLNKSSDLRVVIATSALGMGVDVFECYNTILYGPPKEIVDLLQETGRCGRDGTPSIAVIFCNRYQLTHASEQVKEVIKCTDCRRKTLLCNFSSQNFSTAKKHSCCDLCSAKCNCGSCNVLLFETYLNMFSLKGVELQVSSSDSDTVSYEYESEIESL